MRSSKEVPKQKRLKIPPLCLRPQPVREEQHSGLELEFRLSWVTGRVRGAQFHFCVNWGRRASTYREVRGVGLQLALRLMLFVGGGGSEQTVAVGSAGGS